MRPPVVGREDELARATTVVRRVAEGSCALLLVGEAGIGKTTLLDAVMDEADTLGLRSLVARPSEVETELAFAGLADLFVTVESDDLAALPRVRRSALEQALRRVEGAPAVDPLTVALAVLDALRQLADASPVLIAVDDLQWLDAPSLRAVTSAFRRLDDAPVGLVATIRSAFADEAIRELGRGGTAVERLELAGLGERDLARLVFERTGRAPAPMQLDRLVQLSGGNPYFALELVSGDGITVPRSLGASLRARLSSLSAEARATGFTAAILGRFDSSLLTEDDRRALDELRGAEVVVVRAGALAFAHPLLPSTLIEMHTETERHAVHLQLAARLHDPDERALHLGRGTSEPDEDVAAELEIAADRVDVRGAPETAAILVERAAELTPPADVTAHTRRLLQASDLYQGAGEGSEHVRPLLEGLAGSLPAGPERARVLVRLGWLGAQQDTMPLSASIAYQEQALAEAGGAGDVATAAHAVLARLLGNSGDYRAALAHAELARESGETVAANLMFPSPAGELGTALLIAGEGFDESLFRTGIELEEALGRIGEPYQSPRLQLALALLYTGQLQQARRLLLELLELSTELGRIRSTAGCVLHLTELELRAGDVTQAEAHARAFLHLDGQLRGDLGAEWYPSGMIALHQGRVEDARRILRSGAEAARAAGSRIWLAHHLEALGHLELALGNLPTARAILGELPELLRGTGLGEWAAHPFHPDAIEALVGVGELDEAAALQLELEEYGRRLDRPWGLATAGRSEAMLASARGDLDHALEAAERALEHHARLEWPLELGRTLLVTGEVLRRLGRRREASGRLDEAASTFGALHNPLWLARCEDERRRLGGRSRSGDLTPTEGRVAELASQGLRNAEIAARLYVTPKTVEATLTRVYRKLGVRSRTELARRLVDDSPYRATSP